MVLLRVTNAKIWQWAAPAHAGPAAMLAAADRGEAHGSFASWMLIDNESGEIVSVGEGEPPSSEPVARTFDMGGRLVLPGLCDAHIHVYMLGATSAQVSLAHCESVEEMVASVAAHAVAHPELAWVVGIGWDQSRWGRYPTCHDLDAIEALNGRPCWLWRACWHIGVGNSEALARAGIHRATRVDGGAVELDETTGAPTGVLRERAADAVHALLGEPSPAVRSKFLTEAVRQCASVGLTQVQTHEYGERWCAAEAWSVYSAMQARSHHASAMPSPCLFDPLLPARALA